MKIVALIVARGKSKRLPDKHILNIGGKPVIAYTLMAAKKSKLVDTVVLNSDCADIRAVGKKYGAIVQTRPKRLATDTARQIEALRYAMFKYEEDYNAHTDIIVFLHADCPVRQKGQIDLLVGLLKDRPDADSVVSVRKMRERPEWAYYKNEHFLTPYQDCDVDRKQGLDDLYMIDGYVLAIRRKAFLRANPNGKIHYYLGDKILGIEHDPIYSVDIDTINDFQVAKLLIEDGDLDLD